MSAATRPSATPSELLAADGIAEDLSFNGPFTSLADRAALTVPVRIMAAWAANDADLFAETFTENGSLLMQDSQLTSRERIRAYMADGFKGPLQGAHVTGWPLSVTHLTDTVSMVVTQGGIILAGETEVAPEREIRATWIIVARDGRWRLLSHQSSPISAHGQTEEETKKAMSKAATLVEQAKHWASYYGKYANGPEGAVITVPLRIRAAWDRKDADAFAAMFTENGSYILGDDTLTNPDEIRDFVKDLFAGPAAGTRYHEEPLEIRLLGPDTAIAIMQGGILAEGETVPAPERTHRAVYLTVRRDGDWRLLSLQTNPIRG